jgi:hypothetical protein
MVREWLLLVLRFAVTLEPSDRAAVLGMADELDSLGMRWRPAAPDFFLRTSEELCQAILTAGDGQGNFVLRRHIARIDDPRLRLAFQAAVGIGPGFQPPPTRKRKKTSKGRHLWKGVSSRPRSDPSAEDD